MAEFDSGEATNLGVSNLTRDIIGCLNELTQRERKYNMSRNKRTAIIFNHYNIELYGKTLEPRLGTEKDVERLKDVLSKLHFDVAVYEDYKHSQILDVLKKIQEKDFTDEDCLAIFALTHGNENKIAAKDALYEPDDLWNFFTGNECKTLAGKPKLIFINACRGKGQDNGVQIEDSTLDGPETPPSNMYIIPCMADILVAYSTVKKYLSNRDKQLGTWFIQSLCDNLSDDETGKMELKQILTITSRQVACMVRQVASEDNTETKNITQVPTIVSTLIRDLYLQEQE